MGVRNIYEPLLSSSVIACALEFVY